MKQVFHGMNVSTTWDGQHIKALWTVREVISMCQPAYEGTQYWEHRYNNDISFTNKTLKFISGTKCLPFSFLVPEPVWQSIHLPPVGTRPLRHAMISLHVSSSRAANHPTCLQDTINNWSAPACACRESLFQKAAFSMLTLCYSVILKDCAIQNFFHM